MKIDLKLFRSLSHYLFKEVISIHDDGDNNSNLHMARSGVLWNFWKLNLYLINFVLLEKPSTPFVGVSQYIRFSFLLFLHCKWFKENTLRMSTDIRHDSFHYIYKYVIIYLPYSPTHYKTFQFWFCFLPKDLWVLYLSIKHKCEAWHFFSISYFIIIN